MDLFAEIEARVRERQGRLEHGEWRFCCPVHADTNPSARWHPKKHVWHCDACKEGGGYVQLAQLLDIDVKKAKPQITATYDYVDEAGELLYQVVRLEPGKNGKSKDFRQRRKVGAEWVWKLSGTRRVLYRLPEVLTARDAQRWVFVVEGEKDADNLHVLGLVATCNAGGAGKWQDDFNEALRGSKVALLPDNDEVGRKHAEQVCQGLYGLAAQLRVIYMPDGHKDVSDWLNAGGTADALKELVQQAAPYAPVENSAAPEVEHQYTDAGNARRLVEQNLEDIRYCHDWRKWLIWTGSHWSLDATAEIERRAKETVQRLFDLAEQTNNSELRKFARRSESRRGIHDMVTLARSEAVISVTSSELDQHTMALNTQNGTLDLVTGVLEPHKRSDAITKVIGTSFDPKATCPIWEAFLSRIMGGNQTLIDFLQRAVGYTLTADVGEQVLFLLYGTGANGKSTFLNILLELIGPYAIQAAPDMLMSKRHETHPTELADLFGRRLAVCNEVESGRTLAEATVKQLTGGDMIRARRMREDFWQFKPTHKIWIAGNHKPVIRGTDHAIWRRIRLIPFTVTIPPEEQDPKLPDALIEELPGILNWALAGCLAWQVGGLGTPDEVSSATAAYRGEMDVIGQFIDDCLLPGPMQSKVKDVYEVYTRWCDDSGERTLPKKRFNLMLEERGYNKGKSTHGELFWFGLGIRIDISEGQDEHES